MSIETKKIIIIFISIFSFNFTNPLNAEEYFDPFFLIKSTAEGQQLLDLVRNAHFDAQLAKQQLDSLSSTGVEDLGLEYKVAKILAYISVYHALSDYQQVENYLKELHLVGVKKGNDWVLSKYFEQQGLLAQKRGHLLKGLEDVNKAIDIATRLNYQEVIALSIAKRAVIHGKMGNGSKALKDYTSALQYFEASEDFVAASTIYSNLVVLYIDRKEYKKALAASDTSLKVQNLLPRKSHLRNAINYINRAIVLSQLDRQDEELAAYTKAQEFAIRSNDVGVLVSVYANLSDYFLRYKNYQLAIERAIKCIETAKKIKDKYVTAICYLNQGLSLVYNKEVEKGFALLDKSLKIVESENMQSTLVDVYMAHAEAYQVTDNHKEANKWIEKRYELLLLQAKDDKDNYFQEIEENFKQTVDDREQLMSSFKSDMMKNILGQETLVKQLWLILAVIAFILSMSILYIFSLRRKLKKKYYV